MSPERCTGLCFNISVHFEVSCFWSIAWSNLLTLFAQGLFDSNKWFVTLLPPDHLSGFVSHVSPCQDRTLSHQKTLKQYSVWFINAWQLSVSLWSQSVIRFPSSSYLYLCLQLFFSGLISSAFPHSYSICLFVLSLLLLPFDLLLLCLSFPLRSASLGNSLAPQPLLTLFFPQYSSFSSH